MGGEFDIWRAELAFPPFVLFVLNGGGRGFGFEWVEGGVLRPSEEGRGM